LTSRKLDGAASNAARIHISHKGAAALGCESFAVESFGAGCWASVARSKNDVATVEAMEGVTPLTPL
jgi:hypothetical protein